MKISRITTSTPDLAQAICELLADLSSRPLQFGKADLDTIVSTPSTYLYLATDDATGRALGMYTLAVCQLPTGTRVWLEDVVVSHTSQGQGLGRQLVEHSISQARMHWPGATMMLTSRPSRKAANSLYRTLFNNKETNVYQIEL